MGDEARLFGLVEAFGVLLRPDQAGFVGGCPRCGDRLVVDGEHWSCGCGSGGPVELVAVFGGFSMSHAVELVRSGWRPDGPPGSVARSTVRPLPLLCDPDSDDEAVIDAVLAHYQGERRSSDQAKGWLAERGVDDVLADELGIGVANRTLGYRLPEANRRDGAKLRDQLMRLGIYRASGHEHFRGCVVVPVLSAEGRVLQLCGMRLANASVEPQWAAGLPGGTLNEAAATSVEVIVVASVDDALAVLGAGRRAVVAPGRPGGFHTADLRLLARGGVQRCTIVGDGLASLAERIGAEGIECALVSPGASLAAVLGRAGDRAAALNALLATATPHRATCMPADDSTATVSAPAVPPAPPANCSTTVSGDAAELHVSVASHHWRVRGADLNKTPDTLRVALAVTDTEHGGFHLDTLDLCQAKARAAFVEAAVAELHTGRPVLVRELAEVLFATEAAIAARDSAAPVAAMTEAQRAEAMELLADPELAERVTQDLGALGVVGEETNLLVAYLATISRKAERPFGVVVQSSTAAGKSTLADAVCQLVPEEDLASYSAVTGQALYYVGAADLAHKVLAVAEEQGASRASYALKLLVSEGHLSIASTGKDTATGKLRTRSYEVAGPVALVLTTTATDIDPELANRLVVLGVDEDRAQTRAIQAAQRQAATLDGLMARLQRERIVARHRNAQRLIEPLPVVIPDASEIVFPDTATRHRRDHQKLLSLICAFAMLHQHQRHQDTIEVGDRTVRYVEASPDDVALGMRLAERVLTRGGDDLAPQTRRLLAAAQAHVAACARADNLVAETVSFTRRELRESLGWSEHQVRIGLARLVALEYLVAVPGGSGRQHRYLLADPPDPGPRDTPRPVRDPDPRGENGTHAGRTGDPAVNADASNANSRPVVPVDVDRGTSGGPDRVLWGAR
ncbi:MAG: dnaG [Acidimicrobiaceae bacterium]|nr:dnaG [Acidimicrobiaceae bacterium]